MSPPPEHTSAFRPASRTRVTEILETITALGQARVDGDRDSIWLTPKPTSSRKPRNRLFESSKFALKTHLKRTQNHLKNAAAHLKSTT